ncbi:DUF2946 family protein [Limnohabitans sp. 2KL-3]|uniref:DUF2946 family protein n=1 Tax=Limnohabitans sp. 2KL-3 TaxID=1100700 RepID=UPI000AF0C1C5|nr:DUF2946 family protein [Limnohabitans sp. 2KL-3]
MDDLVKKAMAKWPNVPDCYGWLALDSRGQWFMRDERVQNLGSFQSGVAGSKGSLLKHEKLIEFINRNYAVDEEGCCYFQNGPQKVFVELEITPYVWRVNEPFTPVAHTGVSSKALACLMDELGRVYLKTDLGFGLVHSLDVGLVAETLEKGNCVLEECESQALPGQNHYVMSPQSIVQEKNT